MKKYLFTYVLFLMFIIPATAQIVSDFEADIEGWSSEGDGDYWWEEGTGYPGNNFRVDDDATGDINLSYAPPIFLGNWSGASTSDFISADIFHHKVSGGYASGNFVFQIQGPGGTAKALEGTNPTLFDQWLTYSVNLDPAEWNVISGTWEGILQHVNELVIRMEFINGDEWNRLDNVVLSYTPIVVPVEPVICSDFEDGTYDGWSFDEIGGVSNQSSGGHPGRYIRITDGTGTSMGFAPSKFLGDWSLLDNHAAEIQTDIYIYNFSGTTFLHDFFIKIEGPGGEAVFPIDTDIEKAFDKWHTFAFPVESSYWTIISGTWNDLMANVNKLSLVLEYINGGETVGLDNFCITNLTPEANFEATPLSAFPGYPIQFNDLSLHAPTQWDWNFGDAQTANEENPQHIYSTPGTYDISLTAYNYFGSGSESKTAYIDILDDTQCIKYEDDFEDASLATTWRFDNGTWVENNGILRQTSNYYTNGDYLGGCYALIGSPLWQDYVLSCDFKSTDNDAIGFVFNYQDDQNMYMFLWRKESSERKLFRWENGSFTLMAEDNIPYVQNQWYHAEILSIAGNLIVKINGEIIFDVFDDTFLNGQAGAYCWGNDESHFDNFQIACEGVYLDLTAFLEGPFASGTMSTELNNSGLLSLSQPYSASPWLYNGFESLTSIPAASISDWVLIELRDAPDAASALPATAVGQKAAFLLNDGSVVDLNGMNLMRFSLDVQEQLFAVIWHRNHLPVMSAYEVGENGGVYTYNFTTAAEQAYGNNQADLGNGYFGLIAADLNADGIINNDDLVLWKQLAGENGYLMEDANLDGQADNKDKNDFWYQNQNEEQVLPE